MVTLEEKPAQPRSQYAVSGLYLCDSSVCDRAVELRSSPRGELQITDLNRRFLQNGKLLAERVGRGYAWLDTGTHDALLEPGQFLATLERLQGLKVAYPEEIAYRFNWISAEALLRLAEPLGKSSCSA